VIKIDSLNRKNREHFPSSRRRGLQESEDELREKIPLKDSKVLFKALIKKVLFFNKHKI